MSERFEYECDCGFCENKTKEYYIPKDIGKKWITYKRPYDREERYFCSAECLIEYLICNVCGMEDEPLTQCKNLDGVLGFLKKIEEQLSDQSISAVKMA